MASKALFQVVLPGHRLSGKVGVEMHVIIGKPCVYVLDFGEGNIRGFTHKEIIPFSGELDYKLYQKKGA